MKAPTKSALSTAILAAIASVSVQAEQFIDDSSLNIHLRNYYFHQDAERVGERSDSDRAWAQAIRADFSSGYFANLVGFDLSAHYALKLRDSRGADNLSDTGLFLTNSDGKGESYGKAFGAVKLNLLDNGVAKYGRFVLDTPLLNDSDDDRALPSTTEGFYADYSFHGVTLFGAYAKRAAAQTESGYANYEVNHKRRAVQTVGADYEGHGIKLSTAYATQRDVAKVYYTEGSYTFDLGQQTSLALGAQYGKNKTIGFTRNRDGSAPAGADVIQAGERDDLSWHGVMARFDHDKLTVMASMTDIGGGKNTGLEDADPGWVTNGLANSDNTDFNGYNNVMIDEFNHANEKSWQLHVGYDFSDMIKGLSADVRYVDGSIGRSNNIVKADTSEYNLNINYAVPAMEGLTLTLAHGKYERDVDNNTSTLDVNKDYERTDTRLIATYNLAVF